MRTLILSGSGRYADPWHPLPATSAALAEILRAAGHEVEISEDVEDALVHAHRVNLLVANIADPWLDGDRSPDPEASVTGLARALAAGTGVLALHSAVASLRGYPEWAAATGAIWVPGQSFHPRISRTRIRIEPGVLDGLPGDFDVVDERYCRLQPVGRSKVAAWHAGDGHPEPAAWVREVARARVAVDVLGHDERSYDSEGHRQLVTALAAWAGRSEPRSAE